MSTPTVEPNSKVYGEGGFDSEPYNCLDFMMRTFNYCRLHVTQTATKQLRASALATQTTTEARFPSKLIAKL
jgi:hypothetical protein